MTGRQVDIGSHLECPVCIVTYKDPRIMPCGHTLCKCCMDSLVRGQCVMCPVCRANHATIQTGTDGFPSNFVLAGLIDSLCQECRYATPDGKCQHCDLLLCGDCNNKHVLFDGAMQTFQEVDDTIQNANATMNNAAMEQLGQKLETEIDMALDRVIAKLEERRQSLKYKVRRITQEIIDSQQNWREQLKTKLATTRNDLATLRSHLGDVYDDRINKQDMTDLTNRGQKIISEITRFLATSPVQPEIKLKYDDEEILSVISTLGAIKSSRPKVVGEKGSGPGKFMWPMDVAVCHLTGRVMVADPGNQRVQVLDDDFTHITDIWAADKGRTLEWPWCVTVTNAGDILVSDSGTSRVLVYSGAGTYLRDLPGPWSCPRGIAVDADDTMYVCNADTYTVRVLNKTGSVIRTLGGKGSGPSHFSSQPWYIAIWSRDVIVSDLEGRLLRLSGNVIKKLNSNRIQHETGLTFDSPGKLVIAVREGPVTVLNDTRAKRRVGKSDAKASYLFDDCSDGPWQLCRPGGVAVTKAGQIVVANEGQNNLLVYDVAT